MNNIYELNSNELAIVSGGKKGRKPSPPVNDSIGTPGSYLTFGNSIAAILLTGGGYLLYAGGSLVNPAVAAMAPVFGTVGFTAGTLYFGAGNTSQIVGSLALFMQVASWISALNAWGFTKVFAAAI